MKRTVYSRAGLALVSIAEDDDDDDEDDDEEAAEEDGAEEEEPEPEAEAAGGFAPTIRLSSIATSFNLSASFPTEATESIGAGDSMTARDKGGE